MTDERVERLAQAVADLRKHHDIVVGPTGAGAMSGYGALIARLERALARLREGEA